MASREKKARPGVVWQSLYRKNPSVVIYGARHARINQPSTKMARCAIESCHKHKTGASRKKNNNKNKRLTN